MEFKAKLAKDEQTWSAVLGTSAKLPASLVQSASLLVQAAEEVWEHTFPGAQRHETLWRTCDMTPLKGLVKHSKCR